MLSRVQRSGEDDRFSADRQRAAVGRHVAGQNWNARGLAGAVLADQRMNLAAPQVHRNAAQRPHARIILLQIVEHDKRRLVPIRSRRRRGCWSGGCAHLAPAVVRWDGTAAIMSSSIRAPGALRLLVQASVPAGTQSPKCSASTSYIASISRMSVRDF